MANPEHLEILKQGVEVWNKWREKNIQIILDLTNVDLRGANLSRANLIDTDLSGANLREADLTDANLSGAHLMQTDLRGGHFTEVDLRWGHLTEADLRGADLRGADLRGANLHGANLHGANLHGANLRGADLRGADLSEASLLEANLMEADLSGDNLTEADLRRALLMQVNLRGAHLTQADLTGANLTQANLRETDLRRAALRGDLLKGADLREADLTQADLTQADLTQANFTQANLTEADLSQANLTEAVLNNTDLTKASLFHTILPSLYLNNAKGLEQIVHYGPSYVSTITIQLSQGNLPEVFLRGCGLSDFEIENSKLYNPDLSNQEINDIVYKIYDLRARRSIQISPLFISYSRTDNNFVEIIESQLNQLGLRYWRDVHHATSGPLEKQIDLAIRHNPTVLLILSKNSVSSDWVEHEVYTARDLEKEIKRNVLCPVALDDSWKDCPWPKRIMEQVMKYNILDFSRWEDKNVFEKQFGKLLDGLDLFYK